jgi:YfiH family protein
MSLDYLAAELPAPHGFFTRQGGVSTGLYASLNCSLSGADDAASVRENRARVAAAIGVSPGHLLGLTQVHEAGVIHVTQPWAPGEGASADAMFTTRRGVALGVITADCAPVLFSDATGRCVGAAHAGWRGAVLGVLEATGMAMRSKGALGIRAVIGPCIQQPSYEVGDDLRAQVLARDPDDARFFAPGKAPGKWQFDLPGYCAARLARVDIQATILARDTCAEPDMFFSHRRRTLREEPGLGHQISVIRTV